MSLFFGLIFELHSSWVEDVEWFMPIKDECEGVDDDVNHCDDFEVNDRSFSFPSPHVILKEIYDLEEGHGFGYDTVLAAIHNISF